MARYRFHDTCKCNNKSKSFSMNAKDKDTSKLNDNAPLLEVAFDELNRRSVDKLAAIVRRPQEATR
jgi:hypothetical protein